MSKSKGNVLDPIDIIDGIDLEQLIAKRTSNLMLQSVKDNITQATKQQFPNGIDAYGTDALRFTFCALASNTRTVRFDINRVEGYRNFCNKLWNAARYVLSHTVEEKIDFEDGPFQYSPADQWIMSKLQRVIQQTHTYYQTYRFDLLANALYEFVWHEYCDWYLELSKTVLYDINASSAMKRGTRYTLIRVLDSILKLLHPIMPFITEEIWQRVTKTSNDHADTIMLCDYPSVDEQWIDTTIEDEMDWVKTIIQAVRNIRSEMSLSPAKHIPLLLRHVNQNTKHRLEKFSFILTNLAKIAEIHCLDEQADIPVSASAVVGELELLIPMHNLIDKDAELARLKKELQKLEQDIQRAEGKLNNPAFTDKAPAEIIQKEQEKLEQAKLAREKQHHHQEKIKAL